MPAPARFDHYEVLTRPDGSLHELGRGAMGVTYKAFDTNLQVPVALKVIQTSRLSNEEARERLVREARSAAQLRHRHVASVFHLGVEDETYFYAMEFIGGETVENLVRRKGPMNPVVATTIAIQVARALNAAQQHGLVHRDIKPSNLMLVHEDDELCVKVIDFGLTRSKDAAGAENGAEDTGFVGTPLYASPEQLANRPLDGRSDLYSLGVTLWYMLTGLTPFRGSVAEVVRQHLETPPVIALLQNVAPVLQQLLLRLLAKDPNQRPAGANQLRQELEEALQQIAGGPAAAAARLALEAPPPRAEETGPGTAAALGAFVAGRYEILDAPVEGNAGYIAHARQSESGREVRLIFLREEIAQDATAFTELEREVESLSAVRHANLLEIYGLECAGSQPLVVTEWTRGLTLVELLRARRELPASEALLLLAPAVAGLDHAAAANVQRLDLSLSQIYIHFPGLESSAQHLLREPIARWPEWQLKLNPLGITRELSQSATWAGGKTMVGMSGGDGRGGASTPEGVSFVPALAALFYELLGGTIPPWLAGAHGQLAGRFTPLATLTEEGNAVLRQAMDPATKFPTGAAFHEALIAIDALETAHFDAAAAGRTHRSSSTIAPAPRSAAASPERSGDRSRKIPVGFISGVLTVLTLGGVIYFLVRNPDARSTGTPHLASTAPVSAPPDAAPSAEMPSQELSEAQPASVPQLPTRQDMLKAAVLEAEKLDTSGNAASALAAWLKIAQDFPEAEISKVRMDMLLEPLRTGPHKLATLENGELRARIEEAAKLEVVSAMLILGEHLRLSEPSESFRWYARAAERGHPEANMQTGLMLSNGAGAPRDLERAIGYLQKGMEGGDVAAKAILAECYLFGKGVAKSEPVAIELLTEAAAAGNVRAMNRLGTCYHQGTGVKQNYAEALRYFQQAADLGNDEAAGNLGVLYINGHGVPQNPRKAVRLFQEGAEKGDGYCMYLLARCLESGTGIGANAGEAQNWYKKAAEAGHPRAAEWCRQKGVAFEVKNSAA